MLLHSIYAFSKNSMGNNTRSALCNDYCKVCIQDEKIGEQERIESVKSQQGLASLSSIRVRQFLVPGSRFPFGLARTHHFPRPRRLTNQASLPSFGPSQLMGCISPTIPAVR